jgi:hypothetical protein
MENEECSKKNVGKKGPKTQIVLSAAQGKPGQHKASKHKSSAHKPLTAKR